MANLGVCNMAASCMQILKELAGPGSSSNAASHSSDESDAEPLRKLAAELALVAAAAQAGPRAYVLGRSRGMWVDSSFFVADAHLSTLSLHRFCDASG